MTFVLQLFDLECQLIVKAHLVAAKRQFKAKAFLMSQAALAQLSLASTKIVAFAAQRGDLA